MKIICNDVVIHECEFIEDAMEWMFENNDKYAITDVKFNDEEGIFYVIEIF